MKTLYEQLAGYEERDIYPFHMPGHKRNTKKMEKTFPISQDITEITDFDDLHHPEGVIREAQNRAADLFGAEETWFCVNGSTAAILSAISAAVPRGGEILVARNCHKSVYHGIYLRNLKAGYVYPQKNRELGINGGILPENVEKYLSEHPKTKAVMVTSPTYDGVVSDIRSIAEIAHRYHIPLIVDEAHGAHFVFSDYFPKSAIGEGADLVIHSVHKTLPSLTQTALLHRCSDRVDRELVQKFMGIYQTSSPSYLLMGSIDSCVTSLAEHGKEWFEEYTGLLQKTVCRLSKNQYFKLLTPPIEKETGVFDFDRSKLLISSKNSSYTGPKLHRILHEEYGLEMEMSALYYVNALSSVGDTESGFKRLCDAIEELENKEQNKEKDGKTGNKESSCMNEEDEENNNLKFKANSARSEENSGDAAEYGIFDEGLPARMKIADAMDAESEVCPLKESIGKISCEFGYVYPPGIPLIVPGEEITLQFVESVGRYEKSGLNFIGFRDDTNQTIRVVKADKL